jgi:hypothetical protein
VGVAGPGRSIARGVAPTPWAIACGTTPIGVVKLALRASRTGKGLVQ